MCDPDANGHDFAVVVVSFLFLLSSMKLSDDGVKCLQKFRHVVFADLNHLSIKTIVLHLRVGLDCSFTKRDIEFAGI